MLISLAPREAIAQYATVHQTAYVSIMSILAEGFEAFSVNYVILRLVICETIQSLRFEQPNTCGGSIHDPR